MGYEDNLYDLSNFSKLRKMLKVNNGKKETKESVKKNKHSVNKLSRELTKIESELSSTLSAIDSKVKRIHKEKNPNEFEPYYLRRRPSFEYLSDLNASHMISPTRNRSLSFGNKPSATNGLVSPSVSQDSVSSVGKISDTSANSSRDPSPTRRLSSGVFGGYNPQYRSNISEVIRATRYGGRRMSLPMSFSPAVIPKEPTFISRHTPSGKDQSNADILVSSENITTHLRRMQIDLHGRVPKSIRQLRQSSLTTAEEMVERQSEEEELNRLRNIQATEEFVSGLEKCTYLRQPSPSRTLTVQEIFH